MRRQINADELDELYRCVGRCVWHLQYLEDALHTLLALKVEIRTPGRVSIPEAMSLLTKQRRASLGTALGIAEKHSVLPSELLGRLRALKEERDWLIHRSMHQDGDSLYTDAGRQTIFSRLDAIMESSVSLKTAVMAETEVFTRRHGVCSTQVEAIAEQKIAQLRGDT